VDGVRADSIFFCSEPDIMVCGCLLRRAPEHARKVTLCLSEGGTQCIEQRLEDFRERVLYGEDLFVFDVRGVGAVAPHPVNSYPSAFPMTFFNTEGWFAWSAYCLGESLLGMRVFDVIRAIDYLRDEAAYDTIRLSATGLEASLRGYLAAGLDSRVAEAYIEDLLESFESVVRTELYRTDFTPGMLVHGVLKEFDLPDLRALFSDRVLEIAHAETGLRG
jgi:hypothetical protein